MELKFAWIKDYKNIREEGFNFHHGSNTGFRFLGNRLIIEEAEQTRTGFFAPNILGITAIVGKNGSGKTNLTEFINYNLAHVVNGGLSTYYPSVGLLVVDNYIFAQESIAIENETELADFGFTILRFENAPLDVGQGELRWHEMEKNKYIYYNPAFDNRGIPVEDNLVNISSTMLAYNDRFNSNKLFPLFVSKDQEIDQLKAHTAMEHERISRFLLYFENAAKYIDFSPGHLKVIIDTKQNNHFLRHIYRFDDGTNPNIEWLNHLLRRLDSLESVLLSPDNYRNYITGQRENSSVKYYTITIEEQQAIFRRLLFLQVFRCLVNKGVLFPEDYFREVIFENRIGELEDKSLSVKLMTLESITEKILAVSVLAETQIPMSIDGSSNQKEIETTIFERLGSLEVPLSGQRELLRNFWNTVRAVAGEDILSVIPMGELSSGQTHLLTFFSRFFWAKYKIEESEKADYGINGDTIVIFIDEGEVALHPEWQRRYFSRVTSYLSELFHDRNIQLLITTHSPFVLSDIPKENVLFLERDGEGYCKVSPLGHEETFGGNIYNLLSDSFFMDNTLGKFAEDKIKWVMKSLSPDTEIIQETKEEIRYIIDRIGEPIIKEQLEHMFRVKFEGDEMEILRARIRELENFNRNSNDSSEDR